MKDQNGKLVNINSEDQPKVENLFEISANAEVELEIEDRDLQSSPSASWGDCDW